MKKILVILSLVSFVAVNLSVAQTPQAATKETKKETKSVEKSEKPVQKSAVVKKRPAAKAK